MEGTTYPRMNRVFLTGIAQEEPELRYTPSGVSVCSFRVQVGRILRDRSGGSREVAAYLTVVAWQEAAQRMSRELRKGQAIYVEGYVSSRSFTTARGDKRTAIEIYAEQVQILGPFPEGEPAEQGVAEGMEQAGGPSGGPRRAPRRQDGPRHEAAREQQAESKREQPVGAAGGEAQTEHSAEAGRETEEESTVGQEEEQSESSEKEVDSSASVSEDASQSETPSKDEHSEPQSDETENKNA